MGRFPLQWLSDRITFVVFIVAIVVAFRSVILLESQLVGVLAVPAERDAPRATD
jgi:hypothetical protein